MYSKDKNKRFTLRLTEEQSEFLISTAEMMGVSPSDVLRMTVNSMMYASKTVSRAASIASNDIKEGMRRENEQTYIDNQL